mmetsp:Transcript_25398/g.43217  ORF Transcript_25398/g.43217 Transcript_25398/m.43217 type:complete len:286 (-) Transcript_25398:192-1049(-)
MSENQSTLVNLDLSGNNFRLKTEADANNFASFGRALASCQLVSLNLGNNPIKTHGLIMLQLENASSSLRELKLDNSQLGQGTGSILQRALCSPNCEWSALHLAQSDFSDQDDMQALSEGVSSCNTLETLVMSGCKVTTAGTVHLTNAIMEEPRCKLVTVSIGMNSIGDEGALHWAEALKVNKTIQKLGLRDNKIGDRGVEAILAALRDNNVTVREVILSSNPVTNYGLFRGIRFYSKVNREGRYLLADTHIPPSLWPHVLAKMRYLLDVRYYFLQQKPELFLRNV